MQKIHPDHSSLGVDFLTCRKNADYFLHRFEQMILNLKRPDHPQVSIRREVRHPLGRRLRQNSFLFFNSLSVGSS